MRPHMNIQAQMTGKRKGHRLRGLGHAVGSMSRKTLSLCRLESDMPEEVPQTDGGTWTLGEEGGSWLPWLGTHPLLAHSCCSRSLWGLPAFAVTGGSVPAWWAALPASSCPLGLSTAAPPVPVSPWMWGQRGQGYHPQTVALPHSPSPNPSPSPSPSPFLRPGDCSGSPCPGE